ncbi:MAG: hypothetical protein EOQ92_20320 [Mesorhizobium sp.]|nr:MAG: hypothetical protein EOQ92_20320 [Mesorhizobium sp.]RWK46692.1 MAG: hypothetical protein EOR47_24815 [Mesorhizobium sp.]RWK92382.1 MAG: hypothetical protein EOR53_26350 [Mesorhizobium sp.]TIQ26360.1 MAG: hypothetical protein E5X54_26125 [Mesorhizobium sp.]TJW43651.1 MAG: hypothetical protein E5X59_22235 [Mesorhizobium sp.]
MRGVPAWHRRRSVQHPSTVSALRADPPSPTRGEGGRPLTPFPPPLPPTGTTAPLPTCRATA